MEKLRNVRFPWNGGILLFELLTYAQKSCHIWEASKLQKMILSIYKETLFNGMKEWWNSRMAEYLKTENALLYETKVSQKWND